MSSIKDIAKLAGVSISTVSIIINGKSEERKISTQTQEKVLQAMRQLNYQPNLSAKKLKQAESKKTIALFWTTDFRDVMMAQFLRGLQNRIKTNHLDYDIIIFPYETGHLQEATSFTSITNFHGAIIANANKEDLDYLNTLEPIMPIVLYNRQLPNYPCVYIDDTKIASEIADLLINKTKVSLLTASTSFAGMDIRNQKLIELLGNNYQTTYKATENSTKGGYEAAKNITFSQTNVICCASDMLALGLMHYCFENDIKIPEDIQIIAIGNGLSSIDQYLNPSLTVVQIPLETMAEECISLISNLFENKEFSNIEIMPITIIRQSLTI